MFRGGRAALRQLGGNEHRTFLLKERREPRKLTSRVAQLKTEAATQRKILVYRFDQAAHRSPPALGHGGARARSASKSTRAYVSVDPGEWWRSTSPISVIVAPDRIMFVPRKCRKT
jgi:hypothetical protein